MIATCIHNYTDLVENCSSHHNNIYTEFSTVCNPDRHEVPVSCLPTFNVFKNGLASFFSVCMYACSKKSKVG